MNTREREARADEGAASDGGAIILVRHGRPAVDRRVRLRAQGYRHWWSGYDAAGLDVDQGPPDDLLAVAREAHVIFSSTLARSIETAHAIAGARAVRSMNLFVEARLPPPPVPGLVLKPATWGVVARLSWWLGLSRGEESRREAELRADCAADFLIGEAEGGRTVVVCAHGWFNRMMRPALLARGWRCVRDGGDKYWGFRRFERIAQ